MKQAPFSLISYTFRLQGPNPEPSTQPPTPLRGLSLSTTERNVHYLRDGEVVLYKRPRSRVWQVRYKLYDRQWHRRSTKHHRLDWAMRAAGEIYDRARFREEEGLPQVSRRFDVVARECIKQLTLDIERGIKPHTNKDYVRTINKYLIPFFGKYMLTNVNAKLVHEYEQWRNEQIGRVPISSTLATHSSAFNKVIDLAIQNGWLSDKTPMPRLSRKGRKGSARPAFSKQEVDKLLAYLPQWSEGGKTAEAHEMRLLLRDYIEILLVTGMRSGTESMGMQWKHIEWHTDNKTAQRYIRIWVSGKTGGRWLIAKHTAAGAFERLAFRQGIGKDLATAITRRSDQRVFSLSDGRQPASLHTTYGWLMKECGLAKEAANGLKRTLYSLRHTYATLELLAGTDMHTLAKQMGTSIAMLEQHYSKLTATLAAEKLA